MDISNINHIQFNTMQYAHFLRIHLCETFFPQSKTHSAIHSSAIIILYSDPLLEITSFKEAVWLSALQAALSEAFSKFAPEYSAYDKF